MYTSSENLPPNAFTEGPSTCRSYWGQALDVLPLGSARTAPGKGVSKYVSSQGPHALALTHTESALTEPQHTTDFEFAFRTAESPSLVHSPCQALAFVPTALYHWGKVRCKVGDTQGWRACPQLARAMKMINVFQLGSLVPVVLIPGPAQFPFPGCFLRSPPQTSLPRS